MRRQSRVERRGPALSWTELARSSSSYAVAKDMPMSDKIRRLEAQEILSGSGRPTVGVSLGPKGGRRSTHRSPVEPKGKYEAFELYDGEPRYRGLGVRKAVRNVNELIAPALVGHRVDEQRAIDDLLLGIDGTRKCTT